LDSIVKDVKLSLKGLVEFVHHSWLPADSPDFYLHIYKMCEYLCNSARLSG